MIPKKMQSTKMEGKRPRGRYRTRWIDQIRKDIEIRGENWEQIQENRKWENKDGWRFLYSTPSISLEMNCVCTWCSRKEVMPSPSGKH